MSVSTAKAVKRAFPKLSEINQELVTEWYRNEGAAEDFDSIKEFASFIRNDIEDLIDASDYKSDEVQYLINELVDLDYINENLWEPEEDDLDESYSRRLRESEGLMLRARELADEYVVATPGGQYYPFYCLVDLNNSVRNPRLHGYRDRELMERGQRRGFAKNCGIRDSYPNNRDMADWVAEIDAVGNPNNVFALWTPEAMYPTEYGKQNADKFIQALENSIAYQHKRGW